MAKIHGKIMDFEGKLLENAEVTFLDRTFNIVATGYSDEDGYYYLQTEEKTNGMVYATAQYGKSYLGFWCHNVNSDRYREMDIVVGQIEFLEFTKLLDRERANAGITFKTLSLKALLGEGKRFSPGPDGLDLRVMIDGVLQEGYRIEVEEVPHKDRMISLYHLVVPVAGIYNPREESILEIQLHDHGTGEKGMVRVLL
jgi:hypothetical protein